MTSYKCIDCGKEYDCALEACPNCGCPSEYQKEPSGQILPEIEPSQEPQRDKPQKAEKAPKRKKRIVLLITLFIIVGLVVVGLVYYQGHSYEIKMVRFEKIASEYKATLDSKHVVIISERIDSVAQKIYFAIDEEGDGFYEDINVHDYAIGETKSVLLDLGKIDDYDFCNHKCCEYEYLDSKLIEDRLFFTVYSYCVQKLNNCGLYYINIRDNTLHFVEQCSSVDFYGTNWLKIHREFVLDESGAKIEKKDYNLLASLNDKAYADNRKEQKQEEARLIEEWKKRDIERVINLDYTTTKESPFIIDHIGTVYVWNDISCRVLTKTIVVPQGKVWQFKKLTSSGYGFFDPKLYYYKVVNGEIILHGKEIPNDIPVVLYPGTYLFGISDLSYDTKPGHRTAKIVFTEKVY